MSPEERQLLAGLFERTKSAAASPRDQEAEAFINEQIKSQPAAAYLLAQTVIVQDQALQAANKRLQELEARVRQLESAPAPAKSGSFLGGLFGGGVGATQAPPPRPAPPPGGPWGAPQQQGNYAPPPNYAAQGYAPQPPMAPQGGGGGFLKGALGAAAGVAGGVLLADSIRGLFHGGAGGVGSNLGIGSGFEPGGGGVHETVINNYYGDAAPGQEDAAYDDQGYDAGPEDADYGADDGGFDGGGDGGFDV